MPESRSRTFSWTDPRETLAVAAGLGGLDFLRRMLAGELPYPPIAELLGARMTEVEEGRVVWQAVPGEEYYNPIGTVHAGFTTTLLDSAMGTAFVSLGGPGQRWTTLELKANFTRAITAETGVVRCVGTVVHRGRTVVTTEARLEDGEGRLLAHATSTILVLGGADRQG